MRDRNGVTNGDETGSADLPVSRRRCLELVGLMLLVGPGMVV
jgi:hypothetical protein